MQSESRCVNLEAATPAGMDRIPSLIETPVIPDSEASVCQR